VSLLNGVAAGIRIVGVGYSVGPSLTVICDQTTSVSATWRLDYEYQNLCTNFDHDPAATTFSGRARLQGVAWRLDDTTSTQVGAAPEIVLTVSVGSYDTSSSFGYFSMTAVSVVDSLYPGYSHPYSNFGVGILGSAQFTSPNACSGSLQAFAHAGGTTIAKGTADFVLTRGGTCPV
jgi:hypothetical protein